MESRHYIKGVGYNYDGGLFDTVSYQHGWVHTFGRPEVANEYAELLPTIQRWHDGPPDVSRDGCVVTVIHASASGDLGVPKRRYHTDYSTVPSTYTSYWYVDGEWLDNNSYWKQQQKEESDDN